MTLKIRKQKMTFTIGIKITALTANTYQADQNNTYCPNDCNDGISMKPGFIDILGKGIFSAIQFRNSRYIR